MTYPFKLAGPNLNRTIYAVAAPALDAQQIGSSAVSGVADNYRGVWSATMSCHQGDIVLRGQTMWLALAASLNVAPEVGVTQWQSLGSYSAFGGAWVATTSYALGDEVTYTGNFWVATANSLNSPPTLTNANWQVAGPTNLDNIADGATYVKYVGSDATGNRLDFSKSLLNKTLDNIGDGSIYARYLASDATGNRLDFAKGLLNKNLTNIPDGTERIAWTTPQQNALYTKPPGENYLYDPNFTSQAFWSAGSISGIDLQSGTLSANQALSCFALDGKGAQQQITIAPGEIIYLSCEFGSATGTASGYFIAYFYQINGTYISELYTPLASGGTQTIAGAAPALAAYAIILIQFNGGASGGTLLAASPIVKIGAQTIGISGSGYYLGDARNGSGITAAGVQYYLSGLTIHSLNATSIQCTAMTLKMGGTGTGDVAYNSSSVGGLTANTLYYLYYLDPGFAGGSVTLNTTTNKIQLASYPDAIYLGYWTTPASGSGGSGGTGGCVEEHAYLETADGSLVQARDAAKGLILKTRTDAGVIGTAPILNDPYSVMELCVSLVTANGLLLVSELTPVNCKAGPFPAYDTTGQEIWTNLNGGGWETILSVQRVRAARRVVRISLGGLSFGASRIAGYAIYSHNMSKP